MSLVTLEPVEALQRLQALAAREYDRHEDLLHMKAAMVREGAVRWICALLRRTSGRREEREADQNLANCAVRAIIDVVRFPDFVKISADMQLAKGALLKYVLSLGVCGALEQMVLSDPFSRATLNLGDASKGAVRLLRAVVDGSRRSLIEALRHRPGLFRAVVAFLVDPAESATVLDDPTAAVNHVPEDHIQDARYLILLLNTRDDLPLEVTQ